MSELRSQSSFAELVLNVAAASADTLRRETLTRSASAMALDRLDQLAVIARQVMESGEPLHIPVGAQVVDAARQIAGLAGDGLDGPADDQIVRDLAEQIVALVEEHADA